MGLVVALRYLGADSDADRVFGACMFGMFHYRTFFLVQHSSKNKFTIQLLISCPYKLWHRKPKRGNGNTLTQEML